MAALFPRVGRTQPRLRIAWWALVAFLCLGVLLHLAPFYYMIMTSFKSGAETLADPPTLWPHHFTLAAWKLVFNLTSAGSGLMDEPFYVYLLNPLVIAALTLLLSLPITSLAAYANSKLQRGPVARWSFLFFIGTLMVPFATVLLPTLLLVRHFPFAWTIGPGTAGPTAQIWNTPWAAIIPGVFNAFNFCCSRGSSIRSPPRLSRPRGSMGARSSLSSGASSCR